MRSMEEIEKAEKELADEKAEVLKAKKKDDDEEEEKEDEGKEKEKSLTVGGLMKGIAKIEDYIKGLKKSSEKIDEETFSEKASANSDEIKKGIEVSAFLEDIVGEVSDSLSKLEKSHGDRAESITKALVDLVETTKGLVDVVKASNERIEKLEITPVKGRKSVIVKGEERFEEGKDTGKLSKAQIVNKLTLLKSKGECSTMDVARFETTGQLPDDIYAKVFPEDKEVQ